MSVYYLSLVEAAQKVRKNSLCKTHVGAAILSSPGRIFAGTNMEQKFHFSVHAEISAIAHMISGGRSTFTEVVLISDRDNFTPCGSCIDWLMQYAENESVSITVISNGKKSIFKLKELMPYYPY